MKKDATTETKEDTTPNLTAYSIDHPTIPTRILPRTAVRREQLNTDFTKFASAIVNEVTTAVVQTPVIYNTAITDYLKRSVDYYNQFGITLEVKSNESQTPKAAKALKATKKGKTTQKVDRPEQKPVVHEYWISPAVLPTPNELAQVGKRIKSVSDSKLSLPEKITVA